MRTWIKACRWFLRAGSCNPDASNPTAAGETLLAICNHAAAAASTASLVSSFGCSLHSVNTSSSTLKHILADGIDRLDRQHQGLAGSVGLHWPWLESHDKHCIAQSSACMFRHGLDVPLSAMTDVRISDSLHSRMGPAMQDLCHALHRGAGQCPSSFHVGVYASHWNMHAS